MKTRLWVLGLGRSGEIPKLNETMAIEIGANMIGEGERTFYQIAVNCDIQ